MYLNIRTSQSIEHVVIFIVFDDLEFIPGSAGMAPDLLESAGSAPFATVRDLLNMRRWPG